MHQSGDEGIRILNLLRDREATCANMMRHHFPKILWRLHRC